MEIDAYDEADLCRKIAKRTSKLAHIEFKVEHTGYCDLVDTKRLVYCEVKMELDIAPAQLIYAIVQKKKRDAKFLALANQYYMMFYKPPSWDKMEAFAKKLDPTLTIRPSNVDRRYDSEAFLLLGKPHRVWTYKNRMDLYKGTDPVINFPRLTPDNLQLYAKLLNKYDIDIREYLVFLRKAEKGSVHIPTKPYYIEAQDRFDPKKSIRVNCGKPISREDHRQLLEYLDMLPKDFPDNVRASEGLIPKPTRLLRGAWFTDDMIATDVIHPIIDRVVKDEKDYTTILDPYGGNGTLLLPFLKDYSYVIYNDIQKKLIPIVEEQLQGGHVRNVDFIAQPTERILKWIPRNTRRLVIVTNPPFGTVSTNALIVGALPSRSDRKKMEYVEKMSREIEISYPKDLEQYGKGDLCIPAIARLIEIVKARGEGTICVFSPMGLYCERKRYRRLLDALLRDFEFVDGSIWSGQHFGGITYDKEGYKQPSVSRKKPVALGIWRYKPGCNTDLASLEFKDGETMQPLKFKRMLLLKDGWNYNEGIDGDEIGTTRNDTFNNPNPKMLKLALHNAGSQMIPENVIIDLRILNIPSELIYGLWSTIVGYRSMTNYPYWIDNAYVHLPDFNDKKVQEILALAILWHLTTVGTPKIGLSKEELRFGGQRLTNGCNYLLETFKETKITNPMEELPIPSFNHVGSTDDYNLNGVMFKRRKKTPREAKQHQIHQAQLELELDNAPPPMKPVTQEELLSSPSRTIGGVIELLKYDNNSLNRHFRAVIKRRIEALLQEIGYWDFIPLPLKVEAE